MIIAKIKQSGQVITLEDKLTTFQYSANLQMQFIRDNRYNDYILTGWYRHLRGEEYLLDIDKDGIFTLGKEIFKQKGTVEFSFSLNNPADEEIVHLGVIEYTVEQSFGSGDAILPEEQDTWIQVVSRVVNDQVSDIWDKDYKPRLEENLEQIEAKTDDIKAAVNEVKQNAVESSTNAKSALDSANLAKNSADKAKLAEEKALEYSASAEQFKNDAYSYADQANLAKTEAVNSATNASNSASSALDSSNKAKTHLDNIVEKVNVFNTTVEHANTALDTKIEHAKTSIDTKVTEATEQADIAKDKAQELSKAIDKVNYLEDVVDTKLTQPYVSSGEIENATIPDSDEGQLRNLKIYGKCTQNIETDIVPTPQREVPIISKKVLANGEVVELRSLKESINLFDLGILSKTDLIPKTGAYRKIDIPLQLKPNTQYTFSYDSWEVPALSWVVLKIVNVDGTTLAGIFNYKNDTADAQSKNKINATFTTDATGKTYFSYYVSEFNENGSMITQVTETFKRLWFTKLLYNIMLVEGTTVPSTYIAPTVRDYKIVDHASKNSWIERNVLLENNCGTENWIIQANNEWYRVINNSIYDYDSANNIFCNKLKVIDSKNKLGDNQIRFSSYNNASIVLRVDNTLTNATLFLEWLKDNNFNVQLPLKTPVIEEIAYSENDSSEFGYSFQDTTSPSPSVPSAVEPIIELNIKDCAKNMFNIEEARNLENWVAVGNGYMALSIPVSKNVILTVSGDNVPSTRQYNAYFSNKVNGTQFFGGWLYRKGVGSNYRTFSNPTDGNFIYLCVSAGFLDVFLEDFKKLQIEDGNIATTYEPYKETAISYVLDNPLCRLNDVKDSINITNKNTKYKISKLILTGGEEWVDSTQKSDRYIAFVLRNLPAKYDVNAKNIICEELEIATSREWDSNILKECLCLTSPLNLCIKLKKCRLETEDIDGFKKYLQLNPITIYYEKKFPTTEPLEPSLIEKAKQLKTFYPITHIISNAPLEFDYKLNLENWHKIVSGEVENAKDVIYNMQVQQNNLEVMQLESALETQYNLDLMKLGGNLC